ncbi:MAG: metallophosphoesterase family protein [Clostridia bacterium]|nr:metallophosphoesterase family protein [Clostridia bacterium]
MKFFKKAFAVMLAVLMLSSAFVLCAAAEENTLSGDSMLKFNEDGKFKIMMFADSQDDETLEETTAQLMREALDAHNPDLVVFLGDNTVANGYENQAKAIETIVTPCVEREIPFTLVFGNHDQEQGVTNEVLLREYQKYPGCLAYDAVPSLYGCGNHNLPILSSKGLDIAFNLWFVDSGTSTAEAGGYDYVREDQINWYKDTAAALKVLNGGEVVPAISFQHIIVPEVYDAVGMIKVPFSIPDFYYNDNNYLPVPNFGAYEGFIFEPPCPSHINGGQMDAWLETGDVMATFYGHDHVNDFITNYEGIDITTVPTVGCNSYGNDINRGVGLITLDENDLTTYEYEALRMYDFALTEGSKIPECDGALSTFEYVFYKIIDQFLTVLHKMVSVFSFIK